MYIVKLEYKIDQFGAQSISLSIDDIPHFLKDMKGLIKLKKKKSLFEETNELFDYAYRILMDDLILDEGNSKFGWGHSYLKFVKDIYIGRILDAGMDPASLTYTAWILDGLQNLYSFVEAKNLKEIKENIESVFNNIIVSYLEPRFVKDQKTESTSPIAGNIFETLTGPISAVTLRHTASIIRCYYHLGTHYDRIYRGFRVLDENIDNILKDRTLTIVEILWSFFNIPSNDIITKYGFHKSDIALTIKKLELALLEKFQWDKGCWSADKESKNRTNIYMNLLVLSELKELQNSSDSEIKNMFQKGFEFLRNNLIDISSGSRGLPFYPGNEPQIGATAVLLDVMKKNRSFENEKEKKALVSSCINFILSEKENQNYLNDTYAYQFASIFKLI